MNEIIKALTELKDNRLLEIILKCTDEDIENQFQNNIQKLNDDDLDLLIGLLLKAGYSYKAIEQILNEQ
tara:strand:+ start:1222 stop:1428 length:207 start_codon:yes stop_codon:yes gene_type:complete